MSETTTNTLPGGDYFRLGSPIADTKCPDGPIENRWAQHKFDNKLVNPSNRRKLSVIIVGTGLAGAAAAATMGEAENKIKKTTKKNKK